MSADSRPVEGGLRLSLPAWSFPSATLPEVRGIARALGFDGLDVGHFYASGLDRAHVLAEPEAAGEELREGGMPVSTYYHHFGDGIVDRNVALPEARAANLADFERLARFCRAAGIPALFVLPGMLTPGRTVGEAIAAAGETLRHGVEIVGQHGVTLTVEPHVRSIVESPEAVLELLAAAPGLKLALDPSHFICLGYPQDRLDPLLPHAAHVHLRQARPGRLQERSVHGMLNLDAFLSALVAGGYDGWVAPEPLHQDFIDSWNVDVVTEVIAMRDLVRAWVV
jgi:sugar phosphate isomerase/epimerase